MMISSFETELSLTVADLHKITDSNAISDMVYNIYEYFLNTSDSGKDQNKWLFRFLATNGDNIDLINSFVNDSYIENLPISLIKTTLLMVEKDNRINSEKIKAIYANFLKDYPLCQL